MKNRFLFLCLFLFVNLTNNIFANEFTFDVEEINISNNGNIINGTNGTARSIDKSLEIKADQLVYNKNLSTLNAIGNVLVKDFDNGLEIKTDQLMYNEILSTLDATGNVLVKDSTNEFFLKSQKIFYDIKNQQISSKSKSQFEDILGNLILSKDFIFKKNEDLIKFNNVEVIDLQKNSLVLDRAFMNVVSKKLIGKDVVIEFKDQSFEKNNEPRLKGNSISSDQDKTIIKNGVFTSCKRNDDCPPWQLSAKEIKQDKKKKNNKL
jgi:LPS-assembly protein